MKHASLFSGIGGPEVAAAMLGWENLFHCEINPFGRKVLEYWFPNSISYEDITKTIFKEWRGKVDVLTGGFPCQPFSYAGKRGGREDERYLWPEMLRAIDEIRPTWVVGENVAGLSTMVEGWDPLEVGCRSSLFQEGDDLHDWLVEQTFTIEKIAQGLEGLGYSVQPVLIPAAAVGAPHRRDRIFVLAHYDSADSYCSDDLRVARENEGSRREERLQERHEIREPGVSNQLRPSVPASSGDPERDGCGFRTDDIEGRGEGAGDDALRNGRIRGEEWITGNPDGQRLQEPVRPGRVEDQQETGTRENDRAERPRRYGRSSDSVREGLERTDESGAGEGGERLRVRRDTPRYDWKSLLPKNRWSEFPTVSPVHRGNDGIPIRLDDLSISFGKWRTESLKAYGNAIVPQVMYRIFEAIQACEA